MCLALRFTFGAVTGVAAWGSGDFNLTGTVDANGNLSMQNNLGDQYTGTISAAGQVTGTYTDYADFGGEQTNWTATRQ